MVLRLLDRSASDRQLRLFSCACCRLIWSLLPDERNRELVIGIENNPSGTFDDPVLHALIVASSSGEHEWRRERAYWAVKYLGRSFYKGSPLDCAAHSLLNTAWALQEKDGTRPAAVESDFARLAQDIFRDPMQAITIDPSWLRWHDGLVERLASAIYDGRRWEQLPILADALEDAGCDCQQLLNHCRNEALHARGCWVLDLLLQKK